MRQRHCGFPREKHAWPWVNPGSFVYERTCMRADKTEQSFQAMIHLAAAVINSR